MTFAEAEMLPLMGRPESWHGKGGQPLGVQTDGTLRSARRFFASLAREAPNPRAAEQVTAIELILAAREANHPQGVLAL